MVILIRLVVAIVIGAITAGILNYFGLLTPTLNGLIGFVAAVIVFFSYDGALPGRRL